MNKNTKKVTSQDIGIYQQLQKLEHVNIIKIISCEEEDGDFLVEEEEFEGRIITAILQEEEIKGDKFYDWILQICDAVEYLSNANPPITGMRLHTGNILIGDGNVLKLTDFSGATNALTNEHSQSKDIAEIVSFIKSVDRKFIRKYISLIEEWDSNKETKTISRFHWDNSKKPINVSEFRRDFIEAYTSQFGIKRVALLGAISTILLVFRVARRLS